MSKSVIVDLPSLSGEFPFRGLRAQFGITQRELARRAQVSECTIRRLEQGEPIGLTKLRRLAPYLDLTFAQALAIMIALDTRDGAYVSEGTSWRASRGAKPGEKSCEPTR